MSIESLEHFITTADLTGIKALLTQQPLLVKSRTTHNVSPLMLSCYYKKPAVTELLLNYLDTINLFEACAVGELGVVESLVTAQPETINFYAEDGFTPLGFACYFGHYEVAKYLVLKGADTDMPSNNGFNVYPLHSAAAGNYTQIARLLVENGAKVNVVQQAGATPLHSAAQNGNIDLLILLLEHGADTNVRMEGGKQPSDLAREKGCTEIADVLS